MKRSTRSYRWVPTSLVALAALGYALEPWQRTTDRARVTLTLPARPESARCLSVIVASDRADRRRFDLGGDGIAGLTLDDLPVGEVVLSFIAFPSICAAVPPGRTPAWVAGPMRITLGRDHTPTLTVSLEPGGGATTAPDTSAAPSPPALRPEGLQARGARATFPAFDGDFFFVAFPRPGGAGEKDSTAAEVRRLYLEPALTAIGFDDHHRIATPAAAPFILPGGIETKRRPRALAQIHATMQSWTARHRPNRNGELAAPPPTDDPGEEIVRPMEYWSFSQRERQLPIEHRGVRVVRPAGGETVSVFGSVLARYHITNEVLLNLAASVTRARGALAQSEGIALAAVRPRDQGQLVLLPQQGSGADSTPRSTALRFAYRVNVDAETIGSGRRAYTVWIDAGNGALLQHAAQSGADAFAPFWAWCRDPSEPQCLRHVRVDDPIGSPPLYRLKNADFEIYRTDLSAPWPPAPVLDWLVPPTDAAVACQDGPSASRAANVLAHLQTGLALVRSGGRLPPFPRPIRVVIDGSHPDSFANFGDLTLTMSGGMAGGPPCPAGTDQFLNAAEDATLIAHELAHLTTLQIQTSNPANHCGAPGCPMTNPANRSLFHDYADGYAAMITETPCIGGWTGKNATAIGGTVGADNHAVARACANASEGSRKPRLLFADSDPQQVFTVPGADQAFSDPAATARRLLDRFPEHRQAVGGSVSPYADGQILGAALWHTWEGVRGRLIGGDSSPVWGRLNTAVWSTGFSPTMCPPLEPGCDVNVYRGARELLLHYADAWLTSNGGQNVNDLFSGFARAGLFLAPVSCMDGPPGDSRPPLDPHFCPEGNTTADAIVDFDDADPADGYDLGAIRIRNRDHVVPGGPPPTFRVWTGAPFRFDPAAAGQADPGSPTLCNDRYLVEVRVAGSLHWEVAATGDAGATGTPCHDEKPMNADLWSAYSSQGARVRVEYRVRTWTGSADIATGRNVRLSTLPGAGLWQPAAGGEFKPPSFVISVDGTPAQ